MTRTLIQTLPILVLGLVLLVSIGCGVGESTNEGKIAATADDYLRALSDGDAGAACAQLTAAARTGLERPCAVEMRAIAARVGAQELASAAAEGVKVDVDGNRGSAEVTYLSPAQLELVNVGERWKIASGYALNR
jgi:uncharacterized protein YdbL (DUF1318 family)